MKYSNEQINAIILKEAKAYLAEQKLMTESWTNFGKRLKDLVPDAVTDTVAGWMASAKRLFTKSDEAMTGADKEMLIRACDERPGVFLTKDMEDMVESLKTTDPELADALSNRMAAFRSKIKEYKTKGTDFNTQDITTLREMVGNPRFDNIFGRNNPIGEAVRKELAKIIDTIDGMEPGEFKEMKIEAIVRGSSDKVLLDKEVFNALSKKAEQGPIAKFLLALAGVGGTVMTAGFLIETVGGISMMVVGLSPGDERTMAGPVEVGDDRVVGSLGDLEDLDYGVDGSDTGEKAEERPFKYDYPGRPDMHMDTEKVGPGTRIKKKNEDGPISVLSDDGKEWIVQGG